jgi:hypothetical protein
MLIQHVFELKLCIGSIKKRSTSDEELAVFIIGTRSYNNAKLFGICHTCHDPALT